ncbi:NAD(P)-binding domain-containing protein [Caldisphaera sp.]|uniref:NAD(P)-binding domain-containing protein n=1 Tax=Caldisphaera sp. TaxID=2060322 RepID=UPI0026BEE75C
MKVGLIGLGVMGYRIAANLRKVNLLNFVYNRTYSKAEEFSKIYDVNISKSVEELAKNSEYNINGFIR